jgi:outer membrane biosynthesis protein TonB
LHRSSRLNGSEKALANRSQHVKRIKIINTHQPVPKKTKIVQTKNQMPTEADGPTSEVKPTKAARPRRVATSRKKSAPRHNKIAAPQQEKNSMPAEAGASAEPSDEQIRLRAYFISERRRRFALPGDAESDWLEAIRQLLAEAGHR